MAAERPIVALSQRRRRLQGFAADASGSTLIEYAYVSGVLMVLMYGVLEFGRVIYVQNALQQAASLAARCAAIDTNNCGTSTQVTAYAATQASAFLTVPSTAFTVTSPDPTCGKQVTATYNFSFDIPFYQSISLDMTATACQPK